MRRLSQWVAVPRPPSARARPPVSGPPGGDIPRGSSGGDAPGLSERQRVGQVGLSISVDPRHPPPPSRVLAGGVSLLGPAVVGPPGAYAAPCVPVPKRGACGAPVVPRTTVALAWSGRAGRLGVASMPARAPWVPALLAV